MTRLDAVALPYVHAAVEYSIHHPKLPGMHDPTKDAESITR